MCVRCLNKVFKAANGAQSRSGSIAVSTKYDGPSLNNKKFEGNAPSTAEKTTNIGKTGWGA